MERKRVFISQPMNGLSDDQIAEERMRILRATTTQLSKKLKTNNFVVMDTTIDLEDEIAAKGINNKGVFYLARSLEMLSTADIAVFGNGWAKARGCAIEHQACESYGIPHIDL